MPNEFDPKTIQKTLSVKSKKYTFFSLSELKKAGLGNAENLPFSIKILLESALRNYDDYQITLNDINNILSWAPSLKEKKDIAFKPGRVILQDFTGVPCIVDLAAMRSAMKRLGGDYKKINPQVPCDLVIDHSLQVDFSGTKDSLKKNLSLEFKRNKERYQFLKWGQKAFNNFRVIPPSTGIIHQINLEYLAKGVLQKKSGKDIVVFPDSVVGTDSHTTMINGIGIVGWGVGGIEAEAVMLGEPIDMLLPEVIGVELKGKLSDDVNATDLVLTITNILRKKGVVDKFVEYYGDGLKSLSLPDRAVVSNMSPEYGATIGIFPVDEETLNYYRLTGRSKEDVDLIEAYMKEQGLFYDGKQKPTQYSDTVELELSQIVPSVAGPKRPQDRIAVSEMRQIFDKEIPLTQKDPVDNLENGAVVIASITSCTNTSNPSLVMEAGLLAKKAASKGLKVSDIVKTSFAPGSQVIEEYLKNADLLKYLEELKFHIVGYGCATCIGNSGPLASKIVDEIQKNNLTVASVLSGNRNFEGRICPYTKLNYLASPALVVAYALAGTVRIDFDKEPLGKDKKGNGVYLKDIWPSKKEVAEYIKKHVTANAFTKKYKDVSKGTNDWKDIKENKEDLYKWNKQSTYIQEPPYFLEMEKTPGAIEGITAARALVKVGDSITTDHISPAGNIDKKSPAGRFLIKKEVKESDFNSYGSRRGNDQVMARGTFANIRLKNQLAPWKEGSWTTYFPTKELMSIFDAAMKYKETKTPLIVLAGKEYGTGSSRDWAAKGPALLGIKAVLAQSFERIHRSNLAGMGILPLQFKDGESPETLGLKGNEIFDFEGIDNNLMPRKIIQVSAKTSDGFIKKFAMTVRLDTLVEIDYYRNGGILQTVLRKMLA
ncbi:MAG: aconitate hydratase AcnA [Candidatus Omnitrophica bacterium]|nr:aconitate hydratase AcnA [Candidatus Omnitrophota bacterium]